MNRARLLASAVIVAWLAAGGGARADDKEACVAASDQAQTLRDDGKYRAARAALLACSRDACPPIVRRDCEKWLGELDATQPTVVLGARDPKGNDVSGVRVLLDGAPFIDRLEGRPVAVDPGEHVFRYETPGAPAVEQRAIVRVGEKNRALTAILVPGSTPIAAAPPPPSAAVVAEPETEPPTGPRPPIAAYVLAGVGAVAIGSFAYFGLTGRSDVDALRSTCAPNCAQGDVDAARTKLLVADVSLGVGVVSLAAAAWIFFHRDRGPATQSAVRADVESRPGGGLATLTARF